MWRTCCALVLVASCAFAGGPRWHPPLALTHSQLYARNTQQRRFFMLLTGHPYGWRDHRIDHVIAIKRGGIDAWWNMQWQTLEESRAKDREE